MSQAVAEVLPILARGIISLFIIVDPFGNIPIFIGLTEKLDKNQRRKVFQVASLTGFMLLIVVALAGQQIFNFFAISLESFMIAGGILLLIVSVRILIAGGWEERTISPESIGAVPHCCSIACWTWGHDNHHIQPSTIRPNHNSNLCAHCVHHSLVNTEIHRPNLSRPEQNRIIGHR